MTRNCFTYRNAACRVFAFALAVLALPFLPQVSQLHGAEWRFEDAVAAYEKKSKETPPPENCTMFIGSSTWTLWGKLLEEDFAEFQAVNRGFGGSTIPDILIAYDRLILPHKPARIVFFCGGNDLARKTEPDEVYGDFKKFLAKLWKDLPECEVYFVSSSKAPVRKPFWDNATVFNTKVRNLAEKTIGLYYIDTESLMKDDKGETRENLYLADRLHMNRDGQQVWIPVIKKALQEGKEKQQYLADPEKVKQQRTDLGIVPEAEK